MVNMRMGGKGRWNFTPGNPGVHIKLVVLQDGLIVFPLMEALQVIFSNDQGKLSGISMLFLKVGQASSSRRTTRGCSPQRLRAPMRPARTLAGSFVTETNKHGLHDPPPVL